MNSTTENSGISKYTVAFGLSLALASVVNGLLVIAKEKSPAVLAGLQKLGHHWISHSAIILGLFAVCGGVLSQTNDGKGPNLTANRLIKILFTGVVIGALLISVFYLIGD